ncbi:hypothetical protein CEXT_760161 [Caerostris extrusa]|uniref:Uncharacterized protein n=1 Tax=Caerostris extrusa TaxID=172846 RepID=A0AAV4T7W8_CAEEX|nr:hypothetical protein CEXT_760161 [Caerostris extrusa]
MPYLVIMNIDLNSKCALKIRNITHLHGLRPWQMALPAQAELLDLDQQYMRLDSLFAIVPMPIATFGILLNFSMMVVFFRKIHLHCEEGSGRELTLNYLIESTHLDGQRIVIVPISLPI